MGVRLPVAIDAKKRFLEVPVVVRSRRCVVRGVLNSLEVGVVVSVGPVVVVTAHVVVVVVVVILHLVCVFMRLLIVVHAKERFSGVPVVMRQGHGVVYHVPGGMGVSVVVGQREVTEGAARVGPQQWRAVAA